MGPELTRIGLRRGADYLREALSAPAAKLPVSRSGLRSGFFEYLPVRIVTRAGDIYNGMRMNEDAFTIQLMTVFGRVRLDSQERHHRIRETRGDTRSCRPPTACPKTTWRTSLRT